MIKNSLTVLCLLLTLTACKSGPAPVEETEMAPGTGIIEGKNLDLKGSDSGNIAGLYSINFEYDKTTLSNDAKEKLAKNAEYMASNPNVNLQIEGHCDSRGSSEYNLTLGERRATRVKNYMVGLGVKAERFSIISWGEERLIDSDDSESAHTTNRRANFVPLN